MAIGFIDLIVIYTFAKKALSIAQGTLIPYNKLKQKFKKLV
jgi:hypothetical protein